MTALQERIKPSYVTHGRRVRIIGSGAREQALFRLAQRSPQAKYVDIAPGNAANQGYSVPISASDIHAQVADAFARKINLVIVGPEDPLAQGITDKMNSMGIDVFGPNKRGANIESSKMYAVNLMRDAKVPHPHTQHFHDAGKAREYIESRGLDKIVIKRDGLLAGKGVTVPDNQEQVDIALQEAFSSSAGYSERPVLVQDRLEGVEASYMAIVDGKTIIPLLASQDYKKVGENNTGSNTGGMGAIAPSPIMTPELNKRVLDEIMYPILDAMDEKGIEYKGFLYAGLMVDKSGNPSVLEFNCRGGDPEWPVISTLLTPKFDLIDLAEAVIAGKLTRNHILFRPEMVAVGTFVASEGYPEKPITGRAISGLDQDLDPDSFIFTAGIKNTPEGMVTSGGRVALAVNRAETFATARKESLKIADNIIFEGKQLRRDIGKNVHLQQ